MDTGRELKPAAGKNPYVGPRPFQRDEKDQFFGRDREGRDLVSLIASEQVVVFHAQSGTGKTSLLNTRVVPGLEDRGFEVLPSARVSGEIPDTEVDNIFATNVMMSLDMGKCDPDGYRGVRLSEFLLNLNFDGHGFYYQPAVEEGPAEAAPLEEAQAAAPAEVQVSKRILIIDQFEELFNTHPDAWKKREDLFRQLAEAMQQDPYLWVVLSMREDYIAELDPYASLMPGGLRTRYYMRRMDAEGALQAVTQPVAALRPFEAEAAEELVKNLSRIRHGVDEHGEARYVEGESVEPFQLQMVCYQLWDYLQNQPGDKITLADLTRLSESGGEREGVRQLEIVDRALADFYESALRQAKGPGVSERQLRNWFSEQLITPQGTRGLAMEAAGLPAAAVGVLASRHLIHREVRGDRTWYELSHDRLVEPIVQSNRAWAAARQTPLRTAAKQWQAAKSEGLLYREKALFDAQAWARAHPEDVEPYEEAFLEASQQAERQRKLRSRASIAGVIAAMAVVILMGALTVFAIQGQRDARVAQQVATQALGVSLARGTQVADQGTEVAKQAARAKEAQAQAQEQAARAQAASTQAMDSQAYAQAQFATAQWSKELADSERGKAVEAVTQIAASEVEIRDGLSRQLAAQAQNHVRDNLSLALLLGNEAYQVAQTNDAINVLSDTIKLALGRRVEPAGVPLPKQGSYILDVGFNADGTILGWCGGGERYGARDMKTQEELWKYHGDPNLQMFSLAFGPNQTMAISDSATDIALRDAKTGAYVDALNSYATASGIVFSPDNKVLAAGLSNGTVRLWDLPTKKVTKLEGPTGIVWAIAFSPNGRWLASGDGAGQIGLWNTSTRQLISLIPRAHQGTVLKIAWAPDSSWFASAGADGRIDIWDSATVSLLGEPIKERDGIIYGIAVSADGRVLASGSDGKEIIFYDMRDPAKPAILLRQKYSATIRAVAFSPVEPVLAAGDELGNMYLLRVFNQTLPPGLSLLEQACALANRNLTTGEWQTFMGNAPYQRTCPNAP